MKVKCPRDSLLNACHLVAIAVASRTTKPILSNIKAIAEAESLTLMATDLEVGARYELRGIEVQRTGMAILPVNRLISILRESSDTDITMDASEDGTTIRTSTGRFKMLGGVPEEFPDVPGFDTGGEYHEITAGVLRTMIKRVAFAADKKESGARWAVTGILWEVEGDQARLVATDTRRLARMDAKVSVHSATAPAAKGPSHLIPQKAITLLERSLVDESQPIRVCLKNNEALFQAEHVLIQTRLVEGKFPPYRDIIPKKASVKLSIPTAEFLTRVRQAAIMVDEETKRIECHFEEGQLTLRTQGADTGSSEVTMELPDFKAAPIDIAFDPQYLIEMLRAVDGELTLTLEMTDGERPAVFRVGENYLYLVMPLAG